MADDVNQQETQIDLDHYDDMTVGEILSRTRQHYAQTIGQVAVNLRIRETYIEDMESGNLSNMPGRVYAIGFVRAYAEYLGLDGDKIVYLFKVQSVGKKRRPDIKFKKPTYESATPNIALVLGSLLAAIILLVYLSINHTPDQYREVIPPVPDSLKKSQLISYNKPTETIEKEDIIGSKIDTILETEEKQLSLVIESDSWIEIKDENGKVIISQVLKKGNKYEIPENSNQTMVTGNAGGVAVYKGSERVGTLGRNNQVKRNIPLNAQSLIDQ